MNTDNFLTALDKAKDLIMKKEEKKKNNGTKEEPYIVFVNRLMYEDIKKSNLADEEDKYMCDGEWFKFVVLEM